jgi:hypothetical protein
MQRSHFNKSITTSLIGVLLLLLGATAAVAQQPVNLTAGPATLALPDGSSVPMWGYSCGAAVANSTATCAKLNPNSTGWSPVVITVPTGQDLQINLTNHLVFGPSVLSANKIPTSIVIAGQLGGGLGATPSRVDSPHHENFSTTWPIANTGPVFVPPSQPQRVQSFATEVAGAGATAALTWTAPRPGTYLLESGTHPSIQVPMGLIGMVVVTSAPAADGSSAGTAYTNVSYNAEVPVLFSELDPVQNNAVMKAVGTVGFNEAATYGPYAPGPVASINLTNGGSKYTSAPTVTFTPAGATATAVIDTDNTSATFGQVTEIDIVTGGSYTTAPHITISGGGGSGATADAALPTSTSTTCRTGTATATACYPPAVNYTPLYYMINGQAFDKTNSTHSVFAAAPGSAATPVTGQVLVRMVNAGLRMHVPSIVGSQYTPAASTTAANGFALIAEDGNPLPGVPRVQNEVFMAAGKTYDVMINVPAAGASALPVFDRELSLSGNSTNRDSGMLAYIGVNGSTISSGLAGLGAAAANPDTYNAVVAGKTLTVGDVSKGVITNDVNIFGVKVTVPPTKGTLTLASNGTFTYDAPSGWSGGDSFTYCGNGATSGAACTTVTLGGATIEGAGGISCSPAPSFTASNAKHFAIGTPGVLQNCTDAAGYPLTVDKNSVQAITGLTVSADVNGGFSASASAAGTYTFTFQPQNSQGTDGAAVTATVTFPAGSGLNVLVKDPTSGNTITDYRWIIEEDRTFHVDPSCAVSPTGCAGAINFGTNFHTSYMPVVATGCTGANSCESGQTLQGQAVACDVGNGVCGAPDSVTGGQAAVDPSQVKLDPTKRYYISVLPGDAAQPFIAGWAGAPDCAGTQGGTCGHGMGGAPIEPGQLSVTILTEPSPYPPATLTVFVFEDDFPLNGEHDAGGGIDVLSPNEPGLGGFQITLQDDAGGTGDATGTPTYDMFNMPLSNALAGSIDPVTGLDACPITASGDGITGMIITCPTYESDGVTLSPLAGQAMVKNLYQGRYGVVANPSADRIARGEEWLQTNTLDGQKAHDSFMRIGEPSYFQEFGPAGYHVTIGFANPKIINDRLTSMCANRSDCTYGLKGHVTTARMSRTPDERLYGSGTHDSYGFTQCYVSLGDPDADDFAFNKCDDNGNFSFNGIPPGNWKITTFDQWNDQVVDGITTAVALCDVPTSSVLGTNCTYTGPNPLDMGEVAVHQWQADIYTSSFIDLNGDGVRQDNEPGLALVATNNRFRDGSFSNFNSTDLAGNAGFNEIFPLFNWYVIETDATRYKNTGTHVVYDAGGPVDGSKPIVNGSATPCLGQALNSTAAMRPCGNSAIALNMANTFEANPLPTDLRVPGARYCASADCPTGDPGFNPGKGPSFDPKVTGSTGRVDPAWVQAEGWQGFSGQNNFLEFGKKPFVPGENGGIRGHVVYASTRPFDDPRLLLQTSWEPLVPHVTINLYQEGVAADGVTPTMQLVDSTQTSSFDDWSQGFRSDGVPMMNCPGQGTDSSPLSDPYFWFALKDQPTWLDVYSNNGTAAHPLPYDSQFKCYDGMHNWNQLQPAQYDGMYNFPSVTALDTTTGEPVGTHCTICVTDPDANDPYRYGGSTTPVKWTPGHGTPMLPAGKYVVEVVVPPGFELVKEEDKNILIGDNFIAPVTSQFAGLGSIFILPDQAAIGSTFNSTNPQNSTNDLGRSTLPSTESDTGSVEQFWPCVGEVRQVPDFISLFPGSQEVAPFAGAMRNLCDRKEVTITDQSTALAKFYVFTSTHAAAHFTGVITDDFTAEFDPYSPQFGEKFAPAYLPVSFKDWAGYEISRVYSDAWGSYNGLSYSSWEVNPPNPTGYGPTMMVGCMNDAGPIPDPNHPGQMMVDPLFQPGYSQFCYELPFMPGQTGYFDTPVVPTSAFAGGYNPADCNYPDATPAVSKVVGDQGDVPGPWVPNDNLPHTITITALGDQLVDNYGYSGPSATTAPFNQSKVKRHYGFGTSGTVTVGGVLLTSVQWSDGSITGTVNVNGTDVKGNAASVPQCTVQQQTIYSGSTAYCGQLLITTASGQQSIDTVTVTIGGSKPTVLASGQKIQNAIDKANPGDMIIVPPGTYSEMLLMWKPVRLQGVGAASSIIDANPHPAGKLDPWRRQLVCLFGLAMNGREITSANPYDNPNDTANNGGPFVCSPSMQFQIDREPLEATVGWDATLNGNLAEQLIEPTLMGAYEGAGITVLAKGVKFPQGSDPFASDVFPVGTLFLMQRDCVAAGKNPYPSNFLCNPSSIDGLTIQNSSQGGGGINVHAWAHNLQIANNRVKNNQGTLSGGITVGQGEHPDANLVGGTITDPGTCANTAGTTNVADPFCFDVNVNVHNNAVVQNASLGDELFSSTPAGAGGVTFCNGSDYYKFNYNWVCGNMSTGDAGGFAHVGLSFDGDIEHNSILFNQATNPTIVANGGGLLVMGAPDVDPPCGTTTDQDCVSPPGTVTPSDGAGPGLFINANLILGNAADSGSGGGLRLQHINGNEVLNFPNGQAHVTWPTIPGSFIPGLSGQPSFQTSSPWYAIQVQNNIIADNVAGWDGGGASLLDAFNVNIINNSIVSNNSTASSGVLFNSLFAPLASTQNNSKGCTVAQNGSNSCPQPAGLVSITNSAVLEANEQNLPTSTPIVCPTGHGDATGACKQYSAPVIDNDVITSNRAFFIGVGNFGGGLVNQQKIVTLYNAFGTNAVTGQGTTGACDDAGASYWDIGVRGDSGPSDHTGGTLAPQYTFLTAMDPAYSGAQFHNSSAPASLTKLFCDGSRVPPEAKSGGFSGWLVPPGTNESNALPGPVFSLLPSATVDEGNNWINLQWGPLSLVNPQSLAPLADFHPTSSSPVIGWIPSNAAGGANSPYALAPTLDFFGNLRKTNNAVDAGAIEFQGTVVQPALTSISPDHAVRGVSLTVTLTGTDLTGTNAVTVSGTGVTASNIVVVNDTTVTATFTITGNATRSARNVTVGNNLGQTSNSVTFSVVAPTLGTINPTSGVRGTIVPVTLTGTNLTAGTGITVAPATGFTVQNFTVVNDTTVTANFRIANNAALGAHTVAVTMPGGAANSTNTVSFTVSNPSLPTLTSVSPNSAIRGAGAVPVTLTGTNFTAIGTTLTVSGLTFTNFTVVSSTSATATLNVPANAGVGSHNITVSNAAGTSNPVTFTVQGPTLTSISPNPAARGNNNVTLTFTGTNLAGANGVSGLSGNGVTQVTGSFTVVNSTTVTVRVNITAGASTATRNVAVTTNIGTTNTVPFTVQ